MIFPPCLCEWSLLPRHHHPYRLHPHPCHHHSRRCRPHHHHSHPHHPRHYHNYHCRCRPCRRLLYHHRHSFHYHYSFHSSCWPARYSSTLGVSCGSSGGAARQHLKISGFVPWTEPLLLKWRGRLAVRVLRSGSSAWWGRTAERPRRCCLSRRPPHSSRLTWASWPRSAKIRSAEPHMPV